MKRIILVVGLILSQLSFTQTSDPGVTSTASASGNHAFVGTYSNSTFSNWLDTGDSATNYNLLGYSQKYAGFGVANGSNIVSPIIWMYSNAKNALRVRTMNYNGDMTNGTDLFTVRASGKVGVGTTSPHEKFQVGNAFAFHDGGHKVLGFVHGPSGAVDLDNTQYAGELRFDPVSGNLRLGTSSSLTNAPTSHLTITKEGRIGLGTTTPNEKLHVVGTGKFGNGSATPLTLISSLGSRGINLHFNDDVKRGELGWNAGSYFLRNAADSKLFEVHFATGKIATNGASLNYELNIHDPGSGAVDSRMQLTNADTGKTTADGFQIIMNGATNNYKANILNRENSDMGFWTNNTERLTISSIGDVGIGTTDTKGFKLGVNGDIAALEVKIATYANWADYVFNENYKLPTLKEVENHIKEKGHLKDIPSAEEVKNDGFFLGEMDAKLLKKIEELTLYTIEQQKKIEELEAENKELKSLSKRLANIEAMLNNGKQ